MTQVNYREILWLNTQQYSAADISSISGSSRKTIHEVVKRAGDRISEIVSDKSLDNDAIYALLYPERIEKEQMYSLPDFEYIHWELAKKGVNLALLCSGTRVHGKLKELVNDKTGMLLYNLKQFYSLISESGEDLFIRYCEWNQPDQLTIDMIHEMAKTAEMLFNNHEQ